MKVFYQLFAASVVLPAASLILAACSTADPSQEDPSEFDVDTQFAVAPEATVTPLAVTEAPAAFDNLTNGFVVQGDMNSAKAGFDTSELFSDGIGPTFNNISCKSCHASPFGHSTTFDDGLSGTASQISELRAGHFNGTNFVDHPGGSLINDRATDASIQERVLPGNEVLALRMTLSLMGDGFVESIDSNNLAAIANNQPAGQRGTLIQVDVMEVTNANGTHPQRTGRFGWKNQQASLLSFSGDAYVNEMGITNRLFPTENTSNGVVVQGTVFDGRPDPAGVGEDDENDIDEFTEFMRSLKAPPRGPITAAVTRGAGVFSGIGCDTCHIATITTAAAGTVINAGAFTVPAALGDKNIHPFGDFLLHNIGTGDGIVQNGGQGTRNQVRTAPLWGISARNRFMHDGLSFTVPGAIARHVGQANGARQRFNQLNAGQQADLVAFVLSL